MADLFHVWGSDLVLTESGQIDLVSGDNAGMQRVLRRLGTNAGDYIFDLDYGAGLPARVGGTNTAEDLKVLILQQLALEPEVSSDPAPSVSVQNAGIGETSISITYESSSSGNTVSLEV